MAVIIIEDWMIKGVGLSGLELLAFALIHGCTQEGDGCWFGGYDRLAERIGGKQRGTILAVNRLLQLGAIEKSDAMIDGKARVALKSIWDSNSKVDVNLLKMQSASANNTESKDVGQEKRDLAKEVDALYALYPARCPKRDTSTGKSFKCKERIERLLKRKSYEELEMIFNRYISENYGQQYLMNFQTFLNNLPDYSEPEPTIFQSNEENDWLNGRKPQE